MLCVFGLQKKGRTTKVCSTHKGMVCFWIQAGLRRNQQAICESKHFSKAFLHTYSIYFTVKSIPIALLKQQICYCLIHRYPCVGERKAGYGKISVEK